MSKIFELNKLKFINRTDIIEEIKDGYSGALLYKITRGKNKFFLKIFDGQLNEQKIKNIKESISIYKKLNINSLDIIDFGNIDNLDKYYIVYNFIEGINLKSYTNTDKYNLKDIRKIGKKIGKELLKLKMYENYDKELFLPTDINKTIQDTISNFYLLLEKDMYRDIILEYFNFDELNIMKDKLVEYGIILKSIEPKLIHGDIKRANIMVNEQNEFYITDIEEMQINYDILNFKYQMTWSLLEGSEREAAFVKGYFDGIYGIRRPKYFNYTVIFIIILNFFTESYHRYKHSNITGLKVYMQKCRMLFDKINKLDLDKEFII